MTEIKYWIYLLKDNDTLYAYTDNKSHAKLFERDRDMRKFTKIKKSLCKQEVNYLANEYQNGYLKEIKIPIYDKTNEKWFDGIFIMTAEEYFSLTLAEVQLMESDLYKHCWDHPGLFNDDIVKALEVLEYNNVYRQLTATTGNYINNIEIKVKPDLLGLFLRYYGKTMKGSK